MTTNQLPTVLDAESEAAPMVALAGACVFCIERHTTCAVSHPTAAQKIAMWRAAGAL